MSPTPAMHDFTGFIYTGDGRIASIVDISNAYIASVVDTSYVHEKL
jgi:hypothetical protein